jgi:hypothetical protein
MHMGMSLVGAAGLWFGDAWWEERGRQLLLVD